MEKLAKHLKGEGFVSSIKRTSLVFAFILFCFLPERLTVAGLLGIFLLMFLNKVSDENQPATSPGLSLWKASDGQYSADFYKLLDTFKKFMPLENVLQASNGETIIKYLDNTPPSFKEIKLRRSRMKREANDHLIEKRIQMIFENIRDSNGVEYQRGLQEIQQLLQMRSNCLNGLTLKDEVP